MVSSGRAYLERRLWDSCDRFQLVVYKVLDELTYTRPAHPTVATARTPESRVHVRTVNFKSQDSAMGNILNNSSGI